MNQLEQKTADAQQLVDALDNIIFGKRALMETVVASLLAGGHILLEGLPGLGKTVMSKSLASLTSIDYKRIQFTPDLLPADITGTHLLDDTGESRQMKFMPGPVFTNFLLADEINRASPKTQAALLEAMGEGSVTQLGTTHRLDKPFVVMATQNPLEMEGTNPLPEAQLDRFAVKLDVPAADEASLLRMITERRDGSPDEPTPIIDKAGLLACQAAVDDIFLPEAVAVFIARLISMANPEHPDAPAIVKQHVRFGLSPRGAIWLTRIARAYALLDGREGVGFEDVMRAAPDVLAHRLTLHYTAKLDGVTPRALLAELIPAVEKQVVHGGRV